MISKELYPLILLLILNSACKKTPYFESLSQESFKYKVFEVLKIKEFTSVNGCFQNESNAVFGVFLQRLNSNLFSQNGGLKTKVKCDYLIYTPEDYEIETKENFPLLIYLHGGSHRGNNLELLKGYGLPKLIEEGKKFDFIIASPQCPKGTYWSRIDWFGSIYEELCKNYRIDKNRIFVTGISMGGFGAWHAAMDYPNIVDAIVPLCGGCNDSLEICKIKDIPIWTFHGVKDDLIPVNETERLVQRLEECSGDITFTKLENRGHFIQDTYENEEIYRWLLDSVRPKTTKF